jgi:protein TonB
VYVTLSASHSDTRAQFDTTLVMMAPEADRQPTPPPPALDVALKGFQTVVVPTVIPAAIPQIDLQQRFDPRDFTGVGVEGGRADGVPSDPDAVWTEALVDQVPTLLAAPPPDYPSLLRQAGISGRVVLQAVLDTNGHAEPASIKVVSTSHVGFERPGRQWMLKSLFRPARARGRAVRVLVNMPLDFTITASSSGGSR